MTFLTGQSWRTLKSWYTGGGQNKSFGTVSLTDLTRRLVPFVAHASVARKNCRHDVCQASVLGFIFVNNGCLYP